jgi:hypothetical protein
VLSADEQAQLDAILTRLTENLPIWR